MKKEWHELARDPWLISLVSWIPLLLFALMWLIFSPGLARDIPIGLIDLDKTQISRTLARYYEASSALAVDETFADVQSGAAALKNGQIYGLAVIPADFGAEILLGRSPQVTVFVNSQFLLISKIITAALLPAQGTFTATVETGKNLLTVSPVLDIAISTALPTQSQVTPLFNISVNYAKFLISAILPAIWQILMVATTVLALAAKQRKEGLGAWLGGAPIRSLLSQLVPLSILFWVQGICILSFLYIILGWPMHGKWSVLLLTQLFTVWASIAAGSGFFFITKDAAAGLSLSAAYSAPALAFMGVTFPVTDMTLPARIWRSLLPVCHYIEVQVAQVNYGAPFSAALPKLQALGLFCLPLFLSFYLAYRCGCSRQGGAK